MYQGGVETDNPLKPERYADRRRECCLEPAETDPVNLTLKPPGKPRDDEGREMMGGSEKPEQTNFFGYYTVRKLNAAECGLVPNFRSFTPDQ